MAGSIMRGTGGLARHAGIGALAGLMATAATAAFMQSLNGPAGAGLMGHDDAGEPPVGSPQAATRAVDDLAQGITGDPVPDDAKQAATGIFQFAFGTMLGAGYGVAARLVPLITMGRGALFGAGVFLAADEIAVPATGLSGQPQDSPPRTHAFMLAAHVLFGMTAEATRRALGGRR